MTLNFNNRVINVDELATWPPQLLKRVQGVAQTVPSSIKYVPDLPRARTQEEEDDFRSLFQGHRLRAYHATRLFDHEVGMIRGHGLRALTAKLISDRIEAAYKRLEISDEERVLLHQVNVFAAGKEQSRANQVCLFLGQDELLHNSGVTSFLRTWGGEGIYWLPDYAGELHSRLTQLGKPALVVVDLELDDTLICSPELQQLFVAKLLGIRDATATVNVKNSISFDQIAAIWQPGQSEYDRFSHLPSM